MGNYSFKCPDGGQQALDDIKDLLLEMLDEMKNDDNFTDSLWENEDGDVVVKRILRADDGTITTEFLNADGTPYTGSTSSLIPYSRDVIAVSSDYCANNVPYTVVELRDHDSKDLITRIFRNDNDFTESLTAPAGLTKGFCVEADSTVVKYQPVDCDGANVGPEVDATNVKIVNATEVFCAIVNAIDSAKDAIVDAVNQANTDITTAIENSITVLEDIKSELVTANTTLTNISTNTTNINTKLDTLIGKIDVMITSLSSIDTKLTNTNELLAEILVDIGTIGGDLAAIKGLLNSIDLKIDSVITALTSIEGKLDTLHTDLVGIKSTLDSILAQLDHELIITAPTVNCATDGANKVSFYTREKIVWDSEAGTQVSRAVEYSLDGEDFTASKPTGAVSIGACVLSGDITDTLVEFQVEDCDGNPVGTPMDALPTIVLNKQIVSICNFQELADAINAGAKDYTAILTEISSKQTLIKDAIEAFKAENNTNLLEVIANLEDQLTELTAIKTAILDGNIKLGEIVVKLDAINVNLDAIKASVASIDSKLTTITDSITSINTTLQAEFDQTQVKLDELIASVELKGSDCVNAVFTKDCDRDALLAKLDEIKNAVSAGNIDYTAVLNSINTKLDELALIKAELIESNTTLTDIKANTTATNTKLDTVISKLDSQIAELEGIKLSIDVGNIKLDEIFAKLEDILVSVDAIKVDIAEIKIDVEAIKTSVASIDTKLSTVITSLTTIEGKLDTLATGLQTINTTLQTEFDQTQVILNEIKAAILSKGSDCANATFTKDCDRVALLEKLDELKEVEYNINEQWRVTGATPPAPYDTDTTDGASVTFAAGTYHSWDLVVESGIVKIEIAGKIFSHKKGYSQSYDATTLYTNDIIVTQASDDCVATIVTIK